MVNISINVENTEGIQLYKSSEAYRVQLQAAEGSK
jgi:hypothetical protein